VGSVVYRVYRGNFRVKRKTLFRYNS